MKLVLLSLVLLLGVLFSVVPASDKKMGFVFIEGSIRSVDYIYFLMEHVIKIILCYVIYAESTKYRMPLFVFFLIQIVDLIDFVLTFNNPWFYAPVTVNTLGLTIFTLSILYEWK